MVIHGIVPFFGGTSSATHSLEETRLEYLRLTLEGLREHGIEPVVYQTTKDSVDVPGSTRLHTEPEWLPATACLYAQARYVDPRDLVYVTEADQVLHIADDAVFGIPDDSRYITPWRLDLVGPNGEREFEESATYVIDGKKYGVSNGAHHIDKGDKYDVVPIHGNQAAFSGAFLCTTEFFSLIKFRKNRVLPVEHATGFDANSVGQCVRTSWVDRFWIDHLSPQDRWASTPN